MKLIVFVLFTVMGTVYAQTCVKLVYSYDASGNRISRTQINVSGADCVRKGIADSASEQISEDRKVVLFPNPVQELLNIHLVGNWKNEKSQLWLYDAAGKLVSKRSNLDIENQLFFHEMPVGVYVLKLLIDGKMYEYKIARE